MHLLVLLCLAHNMLVQEAAVARSVKDAAFSTVVSYTSICMPGSKAKQHKQVPGCTDQLLDQL